MVNPLYPVTTAVWWGRLGLTDIITTATQCGVTDSAACIVVQFSLNHTFKGPLIRIMARCQIGDKPLPELILAQICMSHGHNEFNEWNELIVYEMFVLNHCFALSFFTSMALCKTAISPMLTYCEILQSRTEPSTCRLRIIQLFNESHFSQDHDDVIIWKHFPRYWPFVRGIHRSRWIPRTKANDAELWCFLWSAPE